MNISKIEHKVINFKSIFSLYWKLQNNIKNKELINGEIYHFNEMGDWHLYANEINLTQ